MSTPHCSGSGSRSLAPRQVPEGHLAIGRPLTPARAVPWSHTCPGNPPGGCGLFMAEAQTPGPRWLCVRCTGVQEPREQQPLTALGLDARVCPTLDVQTAFGTGFPECPALLRSGKVGAGGVGCVAESPGVGWGLLHQAYAPRPRPLGGA